MVRIVHGARPMANTELAEQVLSCGTALAGLILVFLGGVVNAYHGYGAEHQGAVRASYQWRAWIGFLGFVVALSAALLALVALWAGCAALVPVGAALLIGCFGLLVWAALDELRGIE